MVTDGKSTNLTDRAVVVIVVRTGLLFQPVYILADQLIPKESIDKTTTIQNILLNRVCLGVKMESIP